MTVDYDPRDPQIRNDPFPSFRRLQDEDPVQWNPHLRAWVITRYADVRKVALNKQMSPDRLTPFYDSLPEARRGVVGELIRYLNLWMVFRDPPEHTRLRRLMNEAFTPKAVERLRPNVERIVGRLLDDLLPRGRMDLVRDFAYPLPATVIMDMLGVPHDQLDRFKDWSDDLALFLGSARDVPDKYERARRGALEMSSYFREVIADRRRRPGEDVLSALITAGTPDERLTEDELIAAAMLFLFAGHETTTNLISNGIYSMRMHADAWARLVADPSPGLLATAVEECLRYDGPSGGIARVVRVTHEIEGRELKEGDRVFAMLNAANRDPRVFDAPDDFIIDRSPNRHLTFGQGIHFCLGAPLARLEAEIAYREIARRIPDLTLGTTAPDWHDSLIMRGITSLPVHFRPIKSAAA
jgi:cytochrome P450